MPKRTKHKSGGKEAGRWVTMGGKKVFIDGGSERKGKTNARPTKSNASTQVKRKSGSTGKNAPKDKDNKWRRGSTGKAMTKKIK